MSDRAAHPLHTSHPEYASDALTFRSLLYSVRLLLLQPSALESEVRQAIQGSGCVQSKRPQNSGRQSYSWDLMNKAEEWRAEGRGTLRKHFQVNLRKRHPEGCAALPPSL